MESLMYLSGAPAAPAVPAPAPLHRYPWMCVACQKKTPPDGTLVDTPKPVKLAVTESVTLAVAPALSAACFGYHTDSLCARIRIVYADDMVQQDTFSQAAYVVLKLAEECRLVGDIEVLITQIWGKGKAKMTKVSGSAIISKQFRNSLV